MSYKFAFVILHYMTFDDTYECIESIIKNIEYDNFNIVLVDNGSTNDSFKNLIESFKMFKNIYFLRSERNLGFARGMNLGYEFAKSKLKSDFIILLNNDVVIEQKDFLSKIVELYNKVNFAVLGPDIINLSNEHQNPQKIFVTLERDETYYFMLLKNYLTLFLNYIFLEDTVRFFYRRLKNFLKIKRYDKSLPENYNYRKEFQNIKLHGSCLIFSPTFIKRFKGLYSKTFLYLEEDILFYILKKEGLLSFYSPKIKVLHKEDRSTDFVIKKSFKKRRFILKNVIKSLKAYKKLVDNYFEERKDFLEEIDNNY
ncbi:GT2 family glycosyltransferase [Thermosipho japonicus]|uniref:GT2 family glycosyltransferase n=1 Tax=Thermosipho japonicus TaxID=90323 RepID=A0A841GS67_9BACT|nr:glycosyltransferase [Thermosipho japonicus]MBB6062813.1 GT2 family glycosyltransferase [Thermosipho japonicus]